jgi:flagellar biosynthesis GTPase FlhF
LTPICITGSAPLLTPVFSALQPLGLTPAKPLERDPKTTLHSWHQRVVAAGQPQPSRVWQQLAADLLLANIDSPQWAWAEESALHLLDFWAGFDPAVRFVLLAETPAQALLRQRHLGNAAQVLGQWAQKHQTLLRFALRHPERCLLVWGQQAHSEPQALAQKMAQRWAISLSAKPQPPVDAPEPCPLAEHLAAHLCQQQPSVQQLLSDLQACVEPLGLQPPPTHADPVALLSRYQHLSDRSAEAEQLATLQTALKAAQAKAADSDKATAAAQAEMAKTQAALATAQDQLKAALDQTKANAVQAAQVQSELQARQAAHQALAEQLSQAQAQHKEAQEEADTLLLQLHETQEELESYCIQNDELQIQLKAFAALQQRWRQLFASQPSLFATEHIALNADATQPQRFQCHIQGLDMAGRHFEQLQLAVQIDSDGSATLELPRSNDTDEPLLRWPADVPAGGSVALNPSVGPHTPPQRIARYMQLSSADWQLASTLPRLLLAAVHNQAGNLPPDQQASLSLALQQHEQALAPFKRMLRFDQAALTQLATPEQVHLQLSNASHDGIGAALLSLALHTTPSGVRLALGPNTLTATTEPLALHLDSSGWRTPETAALSDTQRLRINALVAALPLALMDAVANGASKDSLSPWGKLAPQLRGWSQLSHTPAPEPVAAPPAAAPVPPVAAPVRAAKSPKATRTAKTTSKTAAPKAPAAPADTQTTPAKRRKATA